MSSVATARSLILATCLAASGVRASASDLAALSAADAVAVALEHNRDIQQARAEVRRAGYRITEARAGALPQISGAWNLDRNLRPMEFVMSIPDSNGVMRSNRLKIGTDYASSLGLSVSQPLYVGGKVGAALQAARTYRTMADQTEAQVRQNVVSGVLQAFNAALLARELEDIANASLAQAQNHLADVRARRQVGAATDYDLLRARVNAANLRPRLIEAQNGTRAALLQLKQAMGVEPGAEVGIVGAFAPPDTSILARVDAGAALVQRPDVAVSRLNTELQRRAVQIARGDYLPTLAATTSLSFNGNSDEARYNRDDWSTSWVAGLSLTFPIFTGFRTGARYQQARVDLCQAETNLRQAEDAAVIEIEMAAMSFRKALEQIATQDLTVGEAREATDIAENLYANGKATQLEVLDVQLALEVARTNLASALYDGAIAHLALQQSLGLLDAGE